MSVFMISDPARCEGATRERIVIGVDEAGRGPLAGPVVAAAVVLCKPRPAGIDDSKKLTREVRGVLDQRIRRRCAYGVGVVEVEHIDRLNIFHATMWAMTLAVAELCRRLDREPDEVLVDGNLTPRGRRDEWRWPARPIVGGDATTPCIAAASIVAKEHRDRIMRAHAKAHPQYGWETNVGYSTPEHLAALRRHGPCPLHRRSFAPVAQADLFYPPRHGEGDHAQHGGGAGQGWDTPVVPLHQPSAGPPRPVGEDFLAASLSRHTTRY